MASPQLQELAQQLRRASERSKKDEIAQILQSLDSQPINTAALRQTKLGKTVAKLKKSTADQNIANQCNHLVSKWKAIVNEEKKKDSKKSAVDVSNHVSAAPTTVTNDSSPQPPLQSVNGDSEPNSGDDNNGTVMNGHNSNGVESNNNSKASIYSHISAADFKTGNKKRDFARNRLLSVLTPTEGSNDFIDTRTLTIAIETAIYNANSDNGKSGLNTQSYQHKFQDIHFNLKKNQSLKIRVLLGNLMAAALVDMSSHDMACDSLKAERQATSKTILEDSRSDLVANMNQMETNDYKCSRCKQRKCSYYQQQTRGADEPMTTFVTCLTCGKRWKCN